MELIGIPCLNSNRRSFLTGLGAAGIGLAGSAVLAGNPLRAEATTSAPAYSEADILNFALNLEYLEAEFYAMATYGATLVDLGVITTADTTGPTTGGNMVKDFSSSPSATIATGLRDDEIDHVKFLRAALGSAAAKKPTINLAALGYGFSSVDSWLMLARQFEDVGVSAYLGGAPSLATNATYLSAAAAILGTEAQHSGAVRWGCIMNGVTSPAVDSLDVPPTREAPFAVGSTGLSVARTPSQVLNIVYHGGKCSGGFYPNGMNGGTTCQAT